MLYYLWKLKMWIRALRLTQEEREACTILSKLVYDRNDRFYKCDYNDAVLEEASEKLGGRDPIEFMGYLVYGKKWRDIPEVVDTITGLEK